MVEPKKIAESAQQQFLQMFYWIDDLYQFILLWVEKQIGWSYAMDNVESSRGKIVMNGPTLQELWLAGKVNRWIMIRKSEFIANSFWGFVGDQTRCESLTSQ